MTYRPELGHHPENGHSLDSTWVSLYHTQISHICIQSVVNYPYLCRLWTVFVNFQIAYTGPNSWRFTVGQNVSRRSQPQSFHQHQPHESTWQTRSSQWATKTRGPLGARPDPKVDNPLETRNDSKAPNIHGRGKWSKEPAVPFVTVDSAPNLRSYETDGAIIRRKEIAEMVPAWNPFPKISTSEAVATIVSSIPSTRSTAEMGRTRLRTGWNPFPNGIGSNNDSSGSKNMNVNSPGSGKGLSRGTDRKSKPEEEEKKPTVPKPKMKGLKAAEGEESMKPKRIVNFGFSIIRSRISPQIGKTNIRNQLIHLMFGPRILTLDWAPGILAPSVDAQLIGFQFSPEMLRAIIAPQVLSPRLRHQLIGGRFEPRFLSLRLFPQLLSPTINTQLIYADVRAPRGLELSLNPGVLSPVIDLQLIQYRPEARLLSLVATPRVLNPDIRLSLLRLAPRKFAKSQVYSGGVLSPRIFASLNDGVTFTNNGVEPLLAPN